MSYRDFVFPQVCDDLGLKLQSVPLFANITPHVLNEVIQNRIENGLAISVGMDNEKARSEFVVAPLLLEVWYESGKRFGLFSGTELNVDSTKGLNGFCDFLFAQNPLPFRVEGPILAIVEAKNDNVRNGFAQCIATMVAANLFNERAGKPIAAIYGCSTTGREWQFLKLADSTVTIDTVGYSVPKEMDDIAGILLHIATGNVPAA